MRCLVLGLTIFCSIFAWSDPTDTPLAFVKLAKGRSAILVRAVDGTYILVLNNAGIISRLPVQSYSSKPEPIGSGVGHQTYDFDKMHVAVVQANPFKLTVPLDPPNYPKEMYRGPEASAEFRAVTVTENGQWVTAEWMPRTRVSLEKLGFNPKLFNYPVGQVPPSAVKITNILQSNSGAQIIEGQVTRYDYLGEPSTHDVIFWRELGRNFRTRDFRLVDMGELKAGASEVWTKLPWPKEIWRDPVEIRRESDGRLVFKGKSGIAFTPLSAKEADPIRAMINSGETKLRVPPATAQIKFTDPNTLRTYQYEEVNPALVWGLTAHDRPNYRVSVAGTDINVESVGDIMPSHRNVERGVNLKLSDGTELQVYPESKKAALVDNGTAANGYTVRSHDLKIAPLDLNDAVPYSLSAPNTGISGCAVYLTELSSE